MKQHPLNVRWVEPAVVCWLALNCVSCAALTDAAPVTAEACGIRPMLNVDGLLLSKSDMLVERSERAPGDGGLCKAEIYEVVKPVVVYRLSGGSAGDDPSYFNRWSLENPSGSAADYRRRNVMCRLPVSMKTVCLLKVGTKISVGFGQSLNCAGEGVVGRSLTLQVFVDGTTEADFKAQLAPCHTDKGLAE